MNTDFAYDFTCVSHGESWNQKIFKTFKSFKLLKILLPKIPLNFFQNFFEANI